MCPAAGTLSSRRALAPAPSSSCNLHLRPPSRHRAWHRYHRHDRKNTERNHTSHQPCKMPIRTCLRRAAFARPAPLARNFHATARAAVKVGDEVPNVDGLMESSPGNKVNLAEEFKSANGYIVGVPGAFTGTCSSVHIPSYINHPNLKKAGQVFVVSVNDPFV